MELDQELEPDMYGGQEAISRPVPAPRVRVKPGPDSGLQPGLGPDSDSEAQKYSSTEGEELSGRKLFDKWRNFEKSDSGVDSGLGLQKESSLHRGLDFRDQPRPEPGPKPESGPRPGPAPTPRPRQKLGSETLSPEPSLELPLPLMSELDFRRSDPGAELEQLQSGRSKERIIDFRKEASKPRADAHLDSIFQTLEVQMVEFVKEQLQKSHKVLTSQSFMEKTSENQGSDQVLSLTLDFLRKMNQEDLADLLLTKTCQPRQSYNIQRLQILRADLVHPRSSATEELTNHLRDFSLGDGQVLPGIFSLCFLIRRRDGGIEEILEVFLPPPDDFPSQDERIGKALIKEVIEKELKGASTLEDLPSPAQLLPQPQLTQERTVEIGKMLEIMAKKLWEGTEFPKSIDAIDGFMTGCTLNEFKQVVFKVFEDGITWERIFVLFCAAGQLAARVVENHLPPFVLDIVQLILDLFRNRLLGWIQAGGGWVNSFSELATAPICSVGGGPVYAVLPFVAGLTVGCLICWGLK